MSTSVATIQKRCIALAFLVIVVLASACSKVMIPNTDVEDTAENRKVVVFCEQYRHAVENRDAVTLLKLASPAYFEDGGNIRTDDDYDYDGLKQFILGLFSKTTGIRYEIRYRRVTFTETNHVYVDYTYAAAYRIPGIKGEEWRHKVADNRLDLVRDGADSFKIVSGM